MEPSSSLCLQMILFTIWIGLSIALVVMGAIYKDDCPIEPRIPIFLMVTGVTHLVISTLFFLKCGLELCISILEGLIGIFSFVWFIIGSIWVFSLFHEHKAPELCDQNLYFFAFGYLIFQYVVIGIGLLIPCIRCASNIFLYERF